jgi:hypothetical protein
MGQENLRLAVAHMRAHAGGPRVILHPLCLTQGRLYENGYITSSESECYPPSGYCDTARIGMYSTVCVSCTNSRNDGEI